MKRIDIVRLKMAKLFNPIIGEISIKTYFSYYGVVKNTAMFALYKKDENVLCLRQTKNTQNQLCGYPLLQEEKIKNYHIVPLAEINLQAWGKLITQIIQDIRQEKVDEKIEKKQAIRTLLSMNINMERMLHRNGIKTVKKLFALGPINTFVHLVKNGNEGSENLLYKLYSAINNIYVENIPESKKRELLKEADEALYKAGLRKRFNVE
ncbi:hypothetical protein B0187_09675 [Haemophilus paracuniculus]|uniref:TfoX C-terminal domain-containing protein n=1 Tax=Haemophilus paracuniculus TaxID=734 RepID=A0A1T0AQ23_9PAST|nr:TfoX/Sxy family DNA transformation protein [Haemophilus paracuniculus]OOR98059.1 hypothetical protein B0187_09675 [Haemophilus paracuniculus]